MPKNIFTTQHTGRAVVYQHPKGGSVSATIKWVRPSVVVQLEYAVPFHGERTTIVAKKDWDRLTLFPVNSLFLVC